jgi:hypothetical protein
LLFFRVVIVYRCSPRLIRSEFLFLIGVVIFVYGFLWRIFSTARLSALSRILGLLFVRLN